MPSWDIALVRRQVNSAVADTTVSFIAPFAAYLPAELLHASGVLSVVTTGLLLGHRSPVLQNARSRLSERSNWASIQFILENAVFLVIGLQLSSLVEDVQGSSLGLGQTLLVGLAVLATVLVLRPLWIFPFRWVRARVSRHERDRLAPAGEGAVVSWAGMRGPGPSASAGPTPARTRCRRRRSSRPPSAPGCAASTSCPTWMTTPPSGCGSRPGCGSTACGSGWAAASPSRRATPTGACEHQRELPECTTPRETEGARSACTPGPPGCTCGSASRAATSGAATPRRVTRARTSSSRATPSCARSSPARRGAGASSTTRSSDGRRLGVASAG